MLSCAISRLMILCFGTLYPAYASYKAVKTKNVKEYVKWMMYWIVFALFTCVETFTDVFLSFWFPFYYEIKVVTVFWLLSPVTKGSSFLYRKFVHPQLAKREKDIDEYLNRAKEQGYHAVLTLGSKGFNYASQVLVQTAMKGGGHFVNHLHRSYSLTDVNTPNATWNKNLAYNCEDETDQADTAAEEDSLPLDDFSNSQTFPSIGRYQSDSEAQGSVASVSGPRRRKVTDDANSGYGSMEIVNNDVSAPSDQKVNRTSARLKVKRTKSLSVNNNAQSSRQESAFEAGSSATLPRASKRSTGRKKNTMPII